MKEKYVGRVVAVRGSVVDVVFAEEIPPVTGLLYTGENRDVIIEVSDHLDENTVRCIALNPTAGLGRGDEATGTDAPIEVPVGGGLLGRMFNLFGEAIDNNSEPIVAKKRSIHQRPIPLAQRVTSEEVFLTGIKVIDLLVPLERGQGRSLWRGGSRQDRCNY